VVDGRAGVSSADEDDPDGRLVDRVDWIVSLDADPIRRNLLITQCYHDLSAELFRRLGGISLNWCSYACWASRTAGGFIRDDEVPAFFRAVLGRAEPIRVSLGRANAALARIHEDAPIPHDGVLDLVRQVVRDVAELIGDGNLKVFAELGPFFARMIQELDEAGADALDRLGEKLKVGVSEKGGQSLLRSALSHYADAMRESDPHRKAERMLLGNGQIGLHEQIRLQPFIAGSIDAPISDSLYDALEQVVEPLRGRVRLAAAAVVSRLFHPVSDHAEKLWQEFATKELMRLSLPDGTLALGADLPARRGQPLYPPVLEQIDDPELAELLQQYGADRPGATGSAAIDWAVLSNRMRYILDLFRSRQLDESLLAQPFTDEQRVAILAGRPVKGKL
jgi:hypothetical protein